MCNHYKSSRTFNINRHLKAKHGVDTGSLIANSVKCKHCPYTTHRADRLKEHTKSIHEQIMYHCQICTYTSTQERSIRRHNKNIHQLEQDEEATEANQNPNVGEAQVETEDGDENVREA